MTPPEHETLLLVEDDGLFRETLARALRARGFEVVEAGSVAHAIARLAAYEPEAAVVDLRLPDGSGLELLAALRDRLPALRAVILTGWGSIATAIEAVRLGAVDFLSKPVDADAVAAALRRSPDAPAGRGGEAIQSVPSLDRVEWEHIQRVLVECGGNVSKAARLLGLHRRSLQRKLGKRPAPR